MDFFGNRESTGLRPGRGHPFFMIAVDDDRHELGRAIF